MRSRHHNQLAIGLALSLCIASAASAEWILMGPKPLVQQSDVIVVATLADPVEISANGIDYGQGVLEIERVLWPDDLNATQLLLRWRNPTDLACPRVDPRSYADKKSIWLLELSGDGTVRADHPERTLELDRPDIDSWISRLWPLTGESSYDEKVYALERYFHTVDLSE